ncbi:hypothetical protein ROHU_029623 [Labeo rohita]|uniref:Uncharacterized protein n=1 Tax=Labeo rohita TaxID=84645 RepID=A0A498M4P5_LABRO|nr:hypothetical protein ROHU_029623 [Labeo rohita]
MKEEPSGARRMEGRSIAQGPEYHGGGRVTTDQSGARGMKESDPDPMVLGECGAKRKLKGRRPEVELGDQDPRIELETWKPKVDLNNWAKPLKEELMG